MKVNEIWQMKPEMIKEWLNSPFTGSVDSKIQLIHYYSDRDAYDFIILEVSPPNKLYPLEGRIGFYPREIIYKYYYKVSD